MKCKIVGKIQWRSDETLTSKNGNQYARFIITTFAKRVQKVVINGREYDSRMVSLNGIVFGDQAEKLVNKYEKDDKVEVSGNLAVDFKKRYRGEKSKPYIQKDLKDLCAVLTDEAANPIEVATLVAKVVDFDLNILCDSINNPPEKKESQKQYKEQKQEENDSDSGDDLPF